MTWRNFETRRKWTPKEDAILRQLWAAGVKDTSLTINFEDRSKQAILGRAKYLKLPPRRKPKAEALLRTNVTKAQYDRIVRRADEKGWTIAQYLRWLIERDIPDFLR